MASILAFLPLTLLFNHGPGTSGGGLGTSSGETLKAGRWEIGLRSDYTSFEHLSRADAEARAAAAGEFDSLASAFTESLSIGYGVTDDLQLGAAIGWYSGNDFVSAEADGLGGATSATADPAGLTDLWLDAKYRLAHGPSGHFALLAGLKLPTGKDDVKLDDGSELEPSSQPGTGAVDERLGLAWSRFLNERWTIDASAAYTLRGTHAGFTVGDRADVGLALGWRATEDVQSYPNHSLSAEVLGVWIGKDREGSLENENSGGTTVYLGGVWRDRLSANLGLGLGIYAPLVHDLNGEQVEDSWKLALNLTWTL